MAVNNPTEEKKAREGSIRLLLAHQQELYETSLKEHKRNSWIVLGVTVLVLGIALYFAIQSNIAFKKKMIEMQSTFNEQKKEIIDTAFYIKDNLIGDYYIDDKKKFEDFMLIGSKTVMLTYDKNKTKKNRRMDKKTLKNYLEITYAGANLVGIDPYLLLAIDKVESSFDTKAVSPVGAIGICQFMPFTARLLANSRTNYNILQVDGYERSKLYDPIYEKKLQIRFVKYLFDSYDGRVEWVLLAYNYGPSKTVRRWWKNGKAVFRDLPQDQQDYAQKVLAVYNQIKDNS